MSVWEAMILGIVQGLTEYLPVSSTAHLKIVPALYGGSDPGAAFTAVIQWGTLMAVVVYFWADIVRIGRAWTNETCRLRFCQTFDARLGWMMIVATIPIVVCGVLFKKLISHEFRSLYVMAGSLIGLALVMGVAEVFARSRKGRELQQVTWFDCLVVGCCQAVALVPGSSRSGTTITGGLFCGLNRETAARFSFLLSLPAIFAAGVHELLSEWSSLTSTAQQVNNLVVATMVSFIVGYAAIAFLLGYLKRHTTWIFIAYRLAVGLLILSLLFLGKLVDRKSVV